MNIFEWHNLKFFIMFLHFPKNRNSVFKIANDKICYFHSKHKKETTTNTKKMK